MSGRGPAGASAAGSGEHDVEAGAPAAVASEHAMPSEAAGQESGLHHRHPHAATAANGGLAPSDSQAALVVAKGATSSRGDLATSSSEKAGSDEARWAAGGRARTLLLLRPSQLVAPGARPRT